MLSSMPSTGQQPQLQNHTHSQQNQWSPLQSAPPLQHHYSGMNSASNTLPPTVQSNLYQSFGQYPMNTSQQTPVTQPIGPKLGPVTNPPSVNFAYNQKSPNTIQNQSYPQMPFRPM
jgi:hypothetical protein